MKAGKTEMYRKEDGKCDDVITYSLFRGSGSKESSSMSASKSHCIFVVLASTCYRHDHKIRKSERWQEQKQG